MLMLTRRIGERIILQTSDGPIVVLLGMIDSGNKARIGIEAPRSVLISREELLSRPTQPQP